MPSDLDRELYVCIASGSSVANKLKRIQWLFSMNQRMTKLRKAKSQHLMDTSYFVSELFDQYSVKRFNMTMPAFALYRGGENSEIAKFLVENGYAVTQPLYVAARKNQHELMRYFLINYYKIDFNFYGEESSSDGSNTFAWIEHHNSKLANAYRELDKAMESFSKRNSSAVEESKSPQATLPAATFNNVKMRSALWNAWSEDGLFIIEFLAARLDDIHKQKMTESDCPWLPEFTQIVFGFLQKMPNTERKKVFEDKLLLSWQSYSPTELRKDMAAGEHADVYSKSAMNPAFFATVPALQTFLCSIGQAKPLGQAFAVKAEELKDIKAKASSKPAAQSVSIASVSQLIKSPIHAHAIVAGERKRPAPLEELKSNYLDRYFNMSELERKQVMQTFTAEKKDEGFDVHDIFYAVSQLANSLGIDNFTFAFVTVQDSSIVHESSSQMLAALSENVRFVLVVMQLSDGSHASAVFVDKKMNKVTCVDPEGFAYGGQRELKQILSGAKAVFEDLEHADLIVPPKGTQFPQNLADNYCGIHTAVILFSLLYQQTDKKVPPIHAEANKLVNQLITIDVAKGILPASQLTHNCLGALLLARTAGSQNRELQKRFAAIFNDAAEMSSLTVSVTARA